LPHLYDKPFIVHLPTADHKPAYNRSSGIGLLDRFAPGEERRSAQRKPYVFGMPKGGEGLVSILQKQVRKTVSSYLPLIAPFRSDRWRQRHGKGPHSTASRGNGGNSAPCILLAPAMYSIVSVRLRLVAK
jgi:hypothetical protein